MRHSFRNLIAGAGIALCASQGSAFAQQPPATSGAQPAQAKITTVIWGGIVSCNQGNVSRAEITLTADLPKTLSLTYSQDENGNVTSKTTAPVFTEVPKAQQPILSAAGQIMMHSFIGVANGFCSAKFAVETTGLEMPNNPVPQSPYDADHPYELPMHGTYTIPLPVVK